MAKKSITIGGLPGSGTTTIAERLSKKLGLRHVNVGELFREKAEEMKMPLPAFAEFCEENPEIDRSLDKKQEELLRRGNIILEGRLSGWIAHLKKIPAFKIWLDCDEKERIRRIVEREGGEYFDKKAEIKERERGEKRRYLKFYGIDINDKSIYDLIIDTTNLSPEEIVEEILKNLEQKNLL